MRGTEDKKYSLMGAHTHLKDQIKFKIIQSISKFIQNRIIGV